MSHCGLQRNGFGEGKTQQTNIQDSCRHLQLMEPC